MSILNKFNQIGIKIFKQLKNDSKLSILKIQTAYESEDFAIRIDGTDGIIDWGDGNTESFSFPYVTTTTKRHVYYSIGEFTVKPL